MQRGVGVRHRELQRAALYWAREQGYGVAALDVGVSQVGGRLDVAACIMEPARRNRGNTVLRAGNVMVLECKTSREEFLRAASSEEQLLEQLRALQERRERWDEGLKKEFPTLREGQTLFPEYDVYRFKEVGGREYEELVREIESVSQQLFSRGKFSRIQKWSGANLHYVVAESGVAHPHELPMGWGLLEWDGVRLGLEVKAVWQDAPDMNRWSVSGKIAVAAAEGLAEFLEQEGDWEAGGTRGLFQRGKRSPD